MFTQKALEDIRAIDIQNASNSENPMNDFKVEIGPTDTISALEFGPSVLQKNLLLAGGWDNTVRCWDVKQNGSTVAKGMKNLKAPVLDVCWTDVGDKVFIASTNTQIKMWDLASDKVTTVGTHEAPIKTCHWIKSPNYSCLMTGSWDKTLKFWDPRAPNPMLSLLLPERCYCADVDYPMAVVGSANKMISIYSLEGTPTLYAQEESPLNSQTRSISVIKYENIPSGYVVGCIAGRMALQYVNEKARHLNYKCMCHRRINQSSVIDVFAVNDIIVHPVHGTIATVGSDGTFCFWDLDQHTRLKLSKTMAMSITKCAFNPKGDIFAYAVGYDWAQGYEFYDPVKKPNLFLHACFDETKPKTS
ncbi:mRNA export factor-like [Teleopsis dalmanni]|uniref:mRNA export factor-like n=1 Tax=Teleopsis dalmanni TaxID=139649 RepID=UPI000D329573|nr:mRNA export factor-like [Teleopsis dalmanni]XP_037948338.1 mRNA export factor-like [Teleopsis dalmanni]XP_037951836.1 mRNA export factor-like [Teleopsis dalmanni]